MILFESSVQFSDHLLNTCYVPVAELGACMNRHCPCPQGIPSSHKGQFVNREFILLKWVVHSCGSSPEVTEGACAAKRPLPSSSREGAFWRRLRGRATAREPVRAQRCPPACPRGEAALRGDRPPVHLLHSLLLYGWTAIDPASPSSCRAFGQTVSGNMVGGMAEASTGAAETQSRAPQPARAEGGFLNTAEGPGPPGGGTA